MKTKLLCITILLLSAIWCSAQTEKFPVFTIQKTGDSTKRMDLVFLPEGYTNSSYDQNRFVNVDIPAAIKVFFGRYPYSDYQGDFNIYYLKTWLTDTGITNTAATCYPLRTARTKYKCTFNGYGVCREILFNVDTVNAVLNQSIPHYTFASIICNSPINGGVSEGSIMTGTNANSLLGETITHECGHSIGGLGDEYSYGYGASCCVPPPNSCSIEEWNCTQDTSINCRWKDTWPGGIKPLAGKPGLILGCNYCAWNWWKDSTACEMNALGYPFCAQCRKRLIYAFNYFVNPVNSFAPSLTATTATNFIINVDENKSATRKIIWYRNGIVDKININTYTPPNGSWNIKVTVQDTNRNLLTTTAPVYSENWASITVNNSPPTQPCGSPQAITVTNITQTTAVLNWATTSGVIYNATTPDGQDEGIQPPVNITSLSPGSTYTCSVQSNCQGTLSMVQNSTFQTIAAPVKPLPPTGVTTANGITIPISWVAVNGAISYTLSLNTGQTQVITAPTTNAIFTGLNFKGFTRLQITSTTATGTSNPASLTFVTP